MPFAARCQIVHAVNATVTVHYYDGLYHEIFNEPEQASVIGDTVAWLDSVMGVGT